MARASSELIEAIKKTASKLGKSDVYQWGHMGSCNCGFLAQELTQLSKHEIHSRAMQKYGDWNEQLNDYCPTSGLLMDDLISEMLYHGLDTDDLKHLEKLSSPKVLAYLPKGSYLKHNVKQDVITYLHAWAEQLEEELLSRIKISDLNQRPIEQNV
ncbi:hypothetical protein [Fulvivirga sediminis]|uniref:Uncharacterized protein n=1 Tax=Fulvivirga sediminis TaxID=2803949 RepID=A0A937K2T0_9BACT|nr:hypothetical protein [Fulvivirga sediminis]MBL3658690.1 hypothetical protein [Fulvivirga sediminis]